MTEDQPVQSQEEHSVPVAVAPAAPTPAPAADIPTETEPTALVETAASPSISPPASNPTPIASTSYQLGGQNVRVFGAFQGQLAEKGKEASTSTSTTPEIPDSFFEASVNDAQSYHSSVVARSKRLNEAPLLTSKHRDEEKLKAEKAKSEKWPTTTIRIKFSNGTQIESQFPSSSPIQPVYAFVRSALNPSAATKTFTLYQPPRSTYPEHPIPQAKKANPHKANIIAPANYGQIKGSASAQLQGGTGGKESLNALGLVPQSVLHVRWEDETMNASIYPAPLLPELLEQMAPLPTPTIRAEESKTPTKKIPAPGEKKMPKWLQKGLGKR